MSPVLLPSPRTSPHHLSPSSSSELISLLLILPHFTAHQNNWSDSFKTLWNPAMLPVLKTLQRLHFCLKVKPKSSLWPSNVHDLSPFRTHLWYFALLHSSVATLATLLFFYPCKVKFRLRDIVTAISTVGGLPPREASLEVFTQDTFLSEVFPQHRI